MSFLANKTLCIIGGSGLVGSNVAKEAINLGVKVISVSRSGHPLPTQEPWTTKVKWTTGNAMNPDTFEDTLKESDAVLHTPGVLIDDVIKKGKKPGEPGTYEYVNKETAIAMGKKLASLGNKKMVYMSASKGLPFVPRYLAAKREAEDFLFAQQNLRVTSIRPGFITTKDNTVKHIMHYPVDIYAGIFGFANSLIPDSRFKDFLGQNLDIDHSINVKNVALSIIIAAFDSRYDGKILYNTDMNSLARMFMEKKV